MNELNALFATYLEKNAEQADLTRAMLERIEQDRAANEKLFREVAAAGFVGNVDRAGFQSWLKKPYDLVPRGKDAYILIIPKFIPFSAGWRMLTNENSEYNHFEITRFTHFLNPLPAWLAEKAGYDAPTWKGVLEGNTLIVTDGDAEKVAQKFGKAVAGRVGNRLTLKPASRFDVLRRMIKEDGILPYAPAPIPRELLRNPDDYKAADPANGIEKFKLRAWQQKSYETFLEWSRLTLIAWGQTGKSFLGLEALAGLRGQKIVFTYRKNLKEQWLTRRLPLLSDEARAEVIVDSYHNLHKYRKEKFSLVILDEAHHVPADLCIDAATLDTQALIGMSASPVREDGNEELIIALCGKPEGMDWEVTETQKPHIHIWLVKDQAQKYAMVQRLAEKRIKGKTFVFTWRLNIGEKLGKLLDVPFIQHKTKNALTVIDENDTVVLSSVGDEGLSAAVDRIIEADFQFGGRAQLLQRYLRAANDTGRKSEFHSIVTQEEYGKYAKRYLIFEYHGLDIEAHDETGRVEQHGARVVASVARQALKRVERKLATEVQQSVKRAVKPERKPTKPKSEMEEWLAVPSVKKLVDAAEAKIGKDAAGFVTRALELCWDSAVSVEEIAIGKAAGKTVVTRYAAGYRCALECELVADLSPNEKVFKKKRFMANKSKIKGLVDLWNKFH